MTENTGKRKHGRWYLYFGRALDEAGRPGSEFFDSSCRANIRELNRELIRLDKELITTEKKLAKLEQEMAGLREEAATRQGSDTFGDLALTLVSKFLQDKKRPSWRKRIWRKLFPPPRPVRLW